MSSSNTTLIIATTFLIILLGIFIVAILFLYQRNQLLAQKHIEEIKAQQEKSILQAQLEIQEQTFRNISREIHDHLGLDLVLSKLHLTSLNYAIHASDKEKIDLSSGLLTKVIQNLRDISRSMNSDLIKESGLFSAIENELAIIKKTNLYQVDFEVNGEICDLDPDKALIVFRIIQESFNNIIKHAKASAIRLELFFKRNAVTISISDNGKGFATDEKHTGSGLKNIRQRTKILEGDFEIISSAGNGTTLKISVPY